MRYTYSATLTASQRTNWRIEDIIGAEKRLDFEKPFLPESLARVAALAFLDPDERVVLNQIRGNGYLCMFGLVEEFILPFVLDHARATLMEDDERTRAFLQFAGEEAKHIHLFKKFRQEFDAGFGGSCQVVGKPQEFMKAVLAHDPLSVALLILHIEWLTQRHYLESVRDDERLDPVFKSLLRHHWMEEAQHTKLDTLIVEELAAARSAEDIAKATEEYLALGNMIDVALAQQVQLDLGAFTRATGHMFDEVELGRFIDVQHQAQRWTFIGSGMSHPNFLATVNAIAPEFHGRLMKLVPIFS
jgi:P-aminobenzoate N-oxygenase AurF